MIKMSVELASISKKYRLPSQVEQQAVGWGLLSDGWMLWFRDVHGGIFKPLLNNALLRLACPSSGPLEKGREIPVVTLRPGMVQRQNEAWVSRTLNSKTFTEAPGRSSCPSQRSELGHVTRAKPVTDM